MLCPIYDHECIHAEQEIVEQSPLKIVSQCSLGTDNCVCLTLEGHGEIDDETALLRCQIYLAGISRRNNVVDPWLVNSVAFLLSKVRIKHG